MFCHTLCSALTFALRVCVRVRRIGYRMLHAEIRRSSMRDVLRFTDVMNKHNHDGISGPPLRVL